MFDFFHNLNLQEIVHFLNANPHIIGIFTFCVVFLEAMAVVGAIVPGVIVMPSIGFLIGSSVVPVGSTFLYAITGAVIGDCLSYFIGAYFKNRIHKMWPFTRWPGLLTRSEKFFRNHGGKSVFIGRFAGPTRAMIPMIAGIMRMSFLRFFFTSVPSAAFWAVSYIVPGVLLGALSLELPPKIAAEFAIWCLLSFIGIWLVLWLIQHFFRRIWRMIDRYIMQAWKYLKTHKESMWLTKALSDPREPDNHGQLTLLIAVFFIFGLFLWVSHQILISGGLVDLSRSVYYLLRSLRTFHLQGIFMLVTFFGDINMLLVAGGMIFLWLIRGRHWYVALHWLGIILLSGTVLTGMKEFMYHPRPGHILFEIDHSSYPSAHVAFGLTFYGFLAVIIARELKPLKRYIVYSIVGILVTLVAFSRIYLGAHWLSDIIAGFLLGSVIVIIATISYRRRHIIRFNVRKFSAVVTSVFLAVWVGYSTIEFNKKIEEYNLVWPKQTVKFNELTKVSSIIEKDLPLYRLNRLGKPIEAFNVIYVGDLAKLSRALSVGGWEPQPVTLDFQNVIKSFSKTSIVHHLSIFPQLYNNRRMVLLFTKNTKQDDVLLIIRLWLSEISLEDSRLPVWIGTVEYHHSKPSIFSLKRFKVKPQFIGATDYLAKNLTKGFQLWKKKIASEKQPPEMKDLHWNGKLLVIRSR